MNPRYDRHFLYYDIPEYEKADIESFLTRFLNPDNATSWFSHWRVKYNTFKEILSEQYKRMEELLGMFAGMNGKLTRPIHGEKVTATLFPEWDVNEWRWVFTLKIGQTNEIKVHFDDQNNTFKSNDLYIQSKTCKDTAILIFQRMFHNSFEYYFTIKP